MKKFYNLTETEESKLQQCLALINSIETLKDTSLSEMKLNLIRFLTAFKAACEKDKSTCETMKETLDKIVNNTPTRY